MPGVTIPDANYDKSGYEAAGSPNFYLGNTFTFFVDGVPYEVLVNGWACGITSPVFSCVGFQVYIWKPECAALAQAVCKHPEGPNIVPDYTTVQVLSDTGTLFQVKPPWLPHFLSMISFVPIPPVSA